MVCVCNSYNKFSTAGPVGYVTYTYILYLYTHAWGLRYVGNNIIDKRIDLSRGGSFTYI